MERQKLNPTLRPGEVLLQNFNGYWKSNELKKPTLQNINLKIDHGTFLGITGKIGSGKSGILGVILDEIPYYSGIY